MQRLFSLYSLIVQMLFNPLDMLRLTFLTGEFGEILFGYEIAVISPHSFFFSLVSFRGYGIRLQITDIVGNLPNTLAEISIMGIFSVIAVNRHLHKPLFRFGSKAGAIGKNKADEMSFWTKDEFLKFVESIADKPMAYVAYNTLFWTGLRIGELMALTRADLDFTAKTLTVNKSYQRLGDRDVITPPKTPKSNRTVSIPDFLCSLLKEYCDSLYDITDSDRIFHTATLEISGRDQQEQKLILAKNPDTLYWELQSKETELWKEPPDPFLKAISKFVTADNPDWAGTATELLEKTGADIPVNSITKRLNINASRLYNEYSIVYRSSRTRDGRRIELHYQLRDSS